MNKLSLNEAYESSINHIGKIGEAKDVLYKRVYVVMQAVGMNFKGIKLLETNQFDIMAVFPEIEDARAYLRGLILTIKAEQRHGKRSERNLDKNYEGGLDFCIQSSFVIIPRFKEVMKSREWKIEDSLDDPEPQVLDY